MNILTVIGDRQVRITGFRRERVQIGDRAIATGRHIITDRHGKESTLPSGVVPNAPCRFCGRLKPINEYCDSTPRCKSEHERAMRIVAGLEAASYEATR